MPFRTSLRHALHAAGIAGLLALGGCGTSFGLAGDETPLTARHKNMQPVPLAPAWRVDLAPSGVSRNEGQQLASAAYDPQGGRLWIGSRDLPWFRAFRASDGHLLWKSELPGGTSGQALFDDGRVVVGTDGGKVVAFHGATGALEWRYTVQGAVNIAPAIAGDALLVVDGSNAVYALDRKAGTWRWQYRREAPGRFALFGEARPTSHDGRVHAGFSDGVLVTLAAKDGAVLWTRDLAPEAEQFEDIDASPIVLDGTLYAASVAGGLYALQPATGEVVWTRNVRGIVVMEPVGGDLIAGLDRGTIVRIDPRSGRARWRVGLAEHEGAPTGIEPLGKLLAVTTATGALHLLDARSGRPVWHFAPGSGFMAPPTTGSDGSLFALDNGGKLYAFRPGALLPPLPPVNPLADGTGRGSP